MVELLKNVISALLRDFHDKALWFFYVEGSDVHHCFAWADFDYVVSSAHAFAFLIKHDAVLIKYTCLSVDHSTGLGKLFSHWSAEMWREATSINANKRVTH